MYMTFMQLITVLISFYILITSPMTHYAIKTLLVLTLLVEMPFTIDFLYSDNFVMIFMFRTNRLCQVTAVKEGLQKYSEKAYSTSGVNQMWILKK